MSMTAGATHWVLVTFKRWSPTPGLSKPVLMMTLSQTMTVRCLINTDCTMVHGSLVPSFHHQIGIGYRDCAMRSIMVRLSETQLISSVFASVLGFCHMIGSAPCIGRIALFRLSYFSDYLIDSKNVWRTWTTTGRPSQHENCPANTSATSWWSSSSLHSLGMQSASCQYTESHPSLLSGAQLWWTVSWLDMDSLPRPWGDHTADYCWSIAFALWPETSHCPSRHPWQKVVGGARGASSWQWLVSANPAWHTKRSAHAADWDRWGIAGANRIVWKWRWRLVSYAKREWPRMFPDRHVGPKTPLHSVRRALQLIS